MSPSRPYAASSIRWISLFFWFQMVLFQCSVVVGAPAPVTDLVARKAEASSTTTSSTPSASSSSRACNGSPLLCDRLYSNVTYLGAHDSFAFSGDPLALARDQEIDIPSQLAMGVRMLQAQSHLKDGVIHFCHTSCALFDGGSVVDYLKNVKTFLDGNPYEVVTLLWTNPEGLNLSMWGDVLTESGVIDLAYTPPHSPLSFNEWPTLGEMIDDGKRLVIFMDTGADLTQLEWIMPEFQVIWEDPFDSTNSSFPCSVDRMHGPLATEDHMYLINHALSMNILPIGQGVLVSDALAASTTNSAQSILANAAGCAPLSGANRNPTFVLLDWVNVGQGVQAVGIMNGLPGVELSANASTTITSSAVDPSSTGKQTSSAASIHPWSWSGRHGSQHGFWGPSPAGWDRVWDVQRTKQRRLSTPLTTLRASENEYVYMISTLPVLHTLMMILRPLYDYLIRIFAIGTSLSLYIVVPLGLYFIGTTM